MEGTQRQGALREPGESRALEHLSIIALQGGKSGSSSKKTGTESESGRDDHFLGWGPASEVKRRRRTAEERISRGGKGLACCWS